MIKIIFVLASLASAALAYSSTIIVDKDSNLEFDAPIFDVDQLNFQSLRASPATLVAAPVTGEATAATVAAIPDSASVVDLSVPSDLVTMGGVVLPFAMQSGNAVRVFQGGIGSSEPLAYTIWARHGDSINSATVLTLAVAANTTRVECTTVSSTRWECTAHTDDSLTQGTISASTTLSASDTDTTYTVDAAVTVTMPACTDTAAIRFRFVVTTAAAFTVQMSPSNYVTGVVLAGGAKGGFTETQVSSTAGGALTALTPVAAFSAGTGDAGLTVDIECAAQNLWVFKATGSNN
jgi:hypothetical protein